MAGFVSKVVDPEMGHSNERHYGAGTQDVKDTHVIGFWMSLVVFVMGSCGMRIGHGKSSHRLHRSRRQLDQRPETDTNPGICLGLVILSQQVKQREQEDP